MAPTLSELSVPTQRTHSQGYAQFRQRQWPARLVVIVEWLVLLSGLIYLVGRTLPHAWQPLNSDFPNYYITARLLKEGYSTDRIYEWIWFQRQKDHLGIKKTDQPVVGFIPHTPFSSLVVWPLTSFEPLTAKHIWIIINLAFLVAVSILLQSLTSIGWRRLALLIVLTYPLHRNLELGQYYILLLLIATLALWCYINEKRVLAGALMGIGFGLKIFPVLFIVYFARKRDLRAVLGLIAGAIATVATSLWIFGPQLHRVYALQVLPWALRGDAMDPYNLGASSLSSLLHRLFLFEPGWNPHPLLHSPALFSILHPLLQMAVLAPAVLLAAPEDRDSRRLQLEWSAFVAASVAISTLPASYHFTLFILPAVVIAREIIRQRDYSSLALLVLVYLGVCFPAWRHDADGGWWPLLAVPRLWFVILFCLLSYVISRRYPQLVSHHTRDRQVWAGILAASLVFSAVGAFHHQQGRYGNYSSRLRMPADMLMAMNPVIQGGSVLFTAMLPDGYRSAVLTPADTRINSGARDQLGQSSTLGRVWTEESSAISRIVSRGASKDSALLVENAEYPVVSRDGKVLVYLRSTKGRSRMWVRTLQVNNTPDIAVTPPDLDVREMAFLPDGSLVFSAAPKHGLVNLFIVDLAGNVHSLGREEARYPAVSDDGHWLAYSRQQGGVWNLWLRELPTGETHRITNAECNDISPAWEADSKTLVYASDCGRALWLTALVRQQVIP